MCVAGNSEVPDVRILKNPDCTFSLSVFPR